MKVTMKRKEDVRRVQITGKSTFIVSLPRRWADEVGIKKGEPITIIEQSDKSLLLLPKDVKKPPRVMEERIEVSSRNSTGSIIRKIISLYLVGYNTIRVVSNGNMVTPTQRRTIKDEIRRKLVGTEVITDSKSELTLQVLLSYPQLAVGDALRRMCTITSSMHKEAVSSLEELNHDLAQEVIKTDDEVDRFSFYIIRQLKAAVLDNSILPEIGLKTPRDCLGYRLITKSVERIADHAVNIARNVLKIKNPVNRRVLNKLVQMNEFCNSTFEKAIISLFKRDYTLADDLIEQKKQIEIEEKEALRLISQERLDTETLSSLRIIVESTVRILDYGSDIAEIVLNLTILNEKQGAVKK